MKGIEHIEKSGGKTLCSVEILPPLKGQNIESPFKGLDPLIDFNLPFIDVTYHREEFEYKSFPTEAGKEDCKKTTGNCRKLRGYTESL